MNNPKDGFHRLRVRGEDLVGVAGDCKGLLDELDMDRTRKQQLRWLIQTGQYARFNEEFTYDCQHAWRPA